MKRHDLLGQQFGNWKVLSYDEELSKQKCRGYWICECQCEQHTIRSIPAYTLEKGRSKSCGCLKSINTSKRCLEDLTGQHFGHWTVLRRGENINDTTTWICQCDCENHTIRQVIAQNLKRGLSQSCGCAHESHGEIRIRKILQKNDFDFKEQYSFDDLKYKKSLKFDFAIFQNNKIVALIEYQGLQHYEPKFNKDQFEIQQIRDNLKRDYCKIHNIKLIEIPYWDYNKLNEDYILNLLNF